MRRGQAFCNTAIDALSFPAMAAAFFCVYGSQCHRSTNVNAIFIIISQSFVGIVQLSAIQAAPQDTSAMVAWARVAANTQH